MIQGLWGSGMGNGVRCGGNVLESSVSFCQLIACYYQRNKKDEREGILTRKGGNVLGDDDEEGKRKITHIINVQ